jgi:hypothetical protein
MLRKMSPSFLVRRLFYQIGRGMLASYDYLARRVVVKIKEDWTWRGRARCWLTLLK